MENFYNESVLLTANDDQLILTSHRIEYNDKDWGKTTHQCIFLENISFIEMNYSSSVVPLIVAAITALLGGTVWGTSSSDMDGLVAGCGVASVISLLWWYFSKQRVISVTAQDGSRLTIPLSNVTVEQVREFLHTLKQAKSNRHQVGAMV